MKRFKTAALILTAVFLSAGIAIAAHHEASVEKGKALFNDPKLGTNGKSCSECHPNGEGMKKAAGRKDLETMVNACVTNALKGKPLDAGSVEMQSLIKYIKSFKKAAVGC